MDRKTIDPEQLDLVEKWPRRHALPDVVALWAASEGSEAKAMAFNAIAQDPRVLQRAARGPAIKMAVQAEDYMLSLENTAMVKSATWAAVARFVQHAIPGWRQSQKTYVQHRDGIGSFVRPIERQPALVDPWHNALRDFPLSCSPFQAAGTRIFFACPPSYSAQPPLSTAGGTIIKRRLIML